MYTLRDFTKTAGALADTLKRISDMGYSAVQLSAVECMNGANPEVDAGQARRMLDDHGLACIATHRSWDNLVNRTDAEIAFHRALGCTFAAIGGIPGEHNPARYRAFLEEARPVIAKLKQAGIRFGHHNHSREFARETPHGMTLEDLLIEQGGADLMLELDLFWIQHAGANSVSILNRCRGRLPVIHVKDKEVIHGTNNTRMAPVGEGLLDWDSILPACEAAGVEWYAVEQDECFRDPFDCLKSSFDFLTAKGI
jgi:sugar phosphate isomerase/epimerase